MRLDKHYHGELQATAQGQMLSALTATKGSAGYVAIEHVTGTLHGRSGSFVLQHKGVMNRGAQQLEIIVVPDSGTGGAGGPERPHGHPHHRRAALTTIWTTACPTDTARDLALRSTSAGERHALAGPASATAVAGGLLRHAAG
jgi:hypothetical protein